MKPYYQDDRSGITIYHGDCREIAPGLGFSGLVLADPQYGIAHPTNYASRGRGPLAGTSDFKPVHGDREPFDPAPWLEYPAVVLWGANYYADKLPPTSGWLVWDKRVQEGVGVNDQADGELAWTNCVKGVRIFRHMWNGFWRDSERGESYHPTQKPVALMSWVLGKIPEPTDVLDPYMGCGPSLVAAKRANRRAIGIEVEERYCEIAAKRLQQDVLFKAEDIAPQPQPRELFERVQEEAPAVEPLPHKPELFEEPA